MADPTDHGRKPFIADIEAATLENFNFRTTLWTGAHLQLTIMSIPPGGDIGLEVHEGNDLFLRVEQGRGRCEMGKSEGKLDFVENVADADVILVPAGTWHNVINIGDDDLKVYVLYGPADHEAGTIHPTQHDAEADPQEH